VDVHIITFVYIICVVNMVTVLFLGIKNYRKTFFIAARLSDKPLTSYRICLNINQSPIT